MKKPKNVMYELIQKFIYNCRTFPIMSAFLSVLIIFTFINSFNFDNNSLFISRVSKEPTDHNKG